MASEQVSLRDRTAHGKGRRSQRPQPGSERGEKLAERSRDSTPRHPQARRRPLPSPWMLRCQGGAQEARPLRSVSLSGFTPPHSPTPRPKAQSQPLPGRAWELPLSKYQLGYVRLAALQDPGG